MVWGSGMSRVITIVAFFSVNYAFCGQKFQDLDSFPRFNIISSGQTYFDIKDRIGGEFLVDHRFSFERIKRAVDFLAQTIDTFQYNFQEVLTQPVYAINMVNISPILSIITAINNYLSNPSVENRTTLSNFLTDFEEDFEEKVELLTQEMTTVYNNFDLDSISVLPETDTFIVNFFQDKCCEIQTIAMCIADQGYFDALHNGIQKLIASIANGQEFLSLYESLQDSSPIVFPELLAQNKKMLDELADLKATVSFLLQLVIDNYS
jgi:hypothetical protein